MRYNLKNHGDGIDMDQTEAWLAHLEARGRKASTLSAHRNNVRQCLRYLSENGGCTDVFRMEEQDFMMLWKGLDVRENVRWSYLSSLTAMVSFHTGHDILRRLDILHNRITMDRVFLSKDDFISAYHAADERQRLIMCLGAYMGLRRAEIAMIRDSDMVGNRMTIHGKGHGENGLEVQVIIPRPVMLAIIDYRRSPMKYGIRKDDFLIQSRSRDDTLHRMSPNRISDTIRDLGQKVGIRMTTHSLRRFFGTTLYYDVGCDLQTMRNLMRHAEVSTTLKCYIDADPRREMEASEKLAEVIEGIVSGTGPDEDVPE